MRTLLIAGLLVLVAACDGGPNDAGRMGDEGDLCGTVAGLGCNEGLFCKHADATCEIADAGGQCRVIPQGCPDNFDPVCGCDGETYGNECEASAAGVSVDHAGACLAP